MMVKMLKQKKGKFYEEYKKYDLNTHKPQVSEN